jgi:cell pole-organizing protein PopZ
MTDSRPQQEPSIEEILASIRRIISDDDDPTNQASAEAQPDDVLELTERVADVAPEPEPEPYIPPAAVVAPVVAAAAAAAAAFVAPRPEHGDDRLVSDPVAAYSTEQFARLADRGGDATDDPLPISGRTLESVVREMLKPMLREWLDTNLPGIVERLVERELRKMAREAEGL